MRGRRAEALLALKQAEDHAVQGDEYKETLRVVFDSYDIDLDGAIDFDQLRECMDSLYPKIEPLALSKQLVHMRNYFRGGGEPSKP